MTDNTQQLNEILNQAVNDTHDKSLNINLSATASHNIRASIVDEAKQAILDLHNKRELEARIDTLEYAKISPKFKIEEKIEQLRLEVKKYEQSS